MSGPTTLDVLRVLNSIDDSLKTLVSRTGSAAPAPQAPAATTATAAPDADLDGKYGDPEVRFTPRDWTGQVLKGNRYSECPPAFLDMLASSLDYFASKSERENAMTNNGKPKAFYERADAARARGWAKRLRNGWQPPTFDAGEPQGSMHPHAVPAEPDWMKDSGGDDGIPF